MRSWLSLIAVVFSIACSGPSGYGESPDGHYTVARVLENTCGVPLPEEGERALWVSSEEEIGGPIMILDSVPYRWTWSGRADGDTAQVCEMPGPDGLFLCRTVGQAHLSTAEGYLNASTGLLEVQYAEGQSADASADQHVDGLASLAHVDCQVSVELERYNPEDSAASWLVRVAFTVIFLAAAG